LGLLIFSRFYRVDAMPCRRTLLSGLSNASCAAVLAAGFALSACSSAPTPTGATDAGSSSRFSGLFGSAPVAAAPAGPVSFNPNDCPPVAVRTGTGALTVSGKGGDSAISDVRYQLSVSDLARQCSFVDGNVVMRIGVQGRIILGPAGAPGQVDVPLRFAVIQDGPTPKTIATKFKRVAAEVPSGQSNVAFSDVDDGLSFPMPSRSDLASYTLYVGFDEIGDAPEKKTAAKKPTPKRN
jgi:hypothetical protein